MKIIHEETHTLLGKDGSWYVFELKRTGPDFDPEIILIKRARMITKDGKSRFFDTIKESQDSESVIERKFKSKLRKD